MLKLQIPRWSERLRIMVLMLAVILPAAALIGFGVYHLRNIQRDKAIEAAIQKDYEQTLLIAEKRMSTPMSTKNPMKIFAKMGVFWWPGAKNIK